MDPAQKLASYMDALRPIIYIPTFDFAVADELIREACGEDLIKSIVEYNNAHGKVHFQTKIPEWHASSFLDEDPPSPSEALYFFLEEFFSDIPMEQVLVLKDVHDELTDPAICAQLKSIALKTMNEEGFWVPIIIVSSRLVIPPELEKLITVFEIPLPDDNEIEETLVQYAKAYHLDSLDDELLSELTLAFKGLSTFEIVQILNLAYQQSGQITGSDKGLILREKELSIKKSGLLEAIHVDETVNIGGLENLVRYLKRKAKIYADLNRALKAGVDLPKGILVVGMPGCGKSLAAKKTAKEFNVPLFRLDVGRLLGKYVGESEENLRRAIRIAEAATPCVLWIDEIEKAFAGVGKDEGGGGVTTRLFGYFLTWMQEKKSTVYVVATANNLTGIPPEFLRKGRFDELFTVNLPNREERKEIFRIHISRRKPNWRSLDINLNKLATAAGKNKTNTYSGADIESIVKTAIEAAFEDNRELTQKDILDAIKKTKPVAEAMPEKINQMKEALKNLHFENASSTPEK